MEKKDKKTKITYKANKKLLKKIIIGSVLLLVLMFAYKPIKYTAQLIYLKSWKTYNAGSFDFNYRLPRAYEKYEKDDDIFGLNESAFMSEYSIEVNEEYVSQKPTIIFMGSNILNGIDLSIECLETSKIDTELEKIAENYFATIELVYEDHYNIENTENQQVNVLGCDGIRSTILFKHEKLTKKLITYLVPTDEKELTIMFFGDEKNINENEKEIEKIVSSIK